MRVAILSPLGRNPGKAHGGITPVVRNLAAALAADGAAVDLVVTLPADSETPAAPGPGIRLVDLGRRHGWGTALALRRYLRRTRPEALLAAGHRYNKAAVVATRWLANRPPLWLSVHNTLSTGLASAGPLRRWRRRAALRHLYPRADGIIAVSEGVAEDFAAVTGLPASTVTVIHNPIAIDAVRTAAEFGPTHPWLRDKTLPVVAAMGRLNRQKDFPTLLRAFHRLQADLPSRLLILGEGPERNRLESLVAELGLTERVALPGFSAEPYRELAGADAFALSSAWEGFGNVLVEALALRVPVVATDCPSGPREILQDGALGRLVPVGNVDAMREGLHQQLTAPVVPGDWEAAVAPYRPERVARRYLEVMGFEVRQ